VLREELNRMSSEGEKGKVIPYILYDQIVKWLPIASVEAVIIMDKALLFLRRKNHPAMGEWWFAGGRIRKGESLEEALNREVKEDLGLEISAYKLINVYSRVFPERHDITIAYLCKCKEGTIMLSNEHSDTNSLEALQLICTSTYLIPFEIHNGKKNGNAAEHHTGRCLGTVFLDLWQ
jgi:ADP-ribose pyrophosphatase YjhB (NUDIX family)